ncbi:hypothetical protein FACS189483_01320 [Spirochaetia bacterium]|nr:hypothetical protein FACS189483_01320 [Spirochaetia bacterium]
MIIIPLVFIIVIKIIKYKHNDNRKRVNVIIALIYMVTLFGVWVGSAIIEGINLEKK